jgi:pantothenate kinase
MTAEAVTLEGFADRLAAAAAGGRVIAALAGAPGAGKSTAAAAVAARLNARAPGACVVVPMDGFHYDDAVLEARGWRARKGAPHSFDAGGLAALLARLRANAEDEVAFPLFDRRLELARAGAGIAPRAARVILAEGNWLLLREPPWDRLAALFDVTAMLDCPLETLADRLAARWREAGLDEAEAERRLRGNDLPNADRVIAGSAEPQLRIRGGA